MHIPKSKRRKNHAAKAVQGIFVGIDRSSYPGYLIYSPEYHTIYVTGNATFDQTEKYDGRISNHQAADTVSKGSEVPVGELERYKYLEGTDHIDPDDGLLYKVTKVEERMYRGQGKFIVAFRAQVLPGGRVSTKCDRDGYHVRDIEKYYNDYMAKILQDYPAKQAERDEDDDAEDGGADVVAEPKRKRHRRRASAALAEMLFGILPDTPTCAAAVDEVNTASVYNESGESPAEEHSFNDTDRYAMLLEAAEYGDPIAAQCLATGASVSPDEQEPNTIKQAYARPDRQQWREAVDSEWDMVNKFAVLSEPMPLPDGTKALNCRWVFKRKRDHHGNVVKYKARLTPQGCFQHFGVDYSDTYAPVARMTTLRYVLALACLLSLQTTSLDFTNAFLNAPLHDDVYINAPPGTPELPRGYVYKLQRALYGLKQSPREWNTTVNDFMVGECGFRQLSVERCLYIKQGSDGSYVLVCMYVDDLVIAYSSRSMFESFVQKIQAKFKITQSESLQKTLGFQIERTTNGGVFMHQKAYIEEVLKRFGMSECNPADTPADHRIKLCKDGIVNAKSTMSSRATQGENSDEAVHGANVTTKRKRKASKKATEGSKLPYRELIGCLLWISMGTRPDISYAVNQCARYSSAPKEEHWTACMRILRYLRGTPDHGLHYCRDPEYYESTPDCMQTTPDCMQTTSSTTRNTAEKKSGRVETSKAANKQKYAAKMRDLKQPVSYAASFYPGNAKCHLLGYSDADYANNPDDRRSITGYVFLFAGAPLSWNSMTQHSVALSTMESEYYAVCKATQEAIYLRMLFEESGMRVDQPLVIKEDNQACISFTKNPGEHTRTKHIDVRSCFVRQWVEHGELVLEGIDTKEQLADILTKALEPQQFCYLRDRLVRPRSSVM